MDVSKLLSLLHKKSLWLARTDTFKDKKEGVFHDAMKQELSLIYKELNTKNSSNLAGIKNEDKFQEFLSDNTYINCWHKNINENMVMWEVYGQTENSVAIKTTAKKLKDSFNLNTVMKFALEVALDEVSYLNHEDAPAESNYRQPFFIKRPHFSFENEVRLYLMARERKTRANSPLGYEIPVDLSILIEEIYVHPDSKSWFFESIKDLVKKYNIKASVSKGDCGNIF